MLACKNYGVFTLVKQFCFLVKEMKLNLFTATCKLKIILNNLFLLY